MNPSEPIVLVRKVLLTDPTALAKFSPGGGTTVHRMFTPIAPGRVQVKVTVSSGQATVGVDISVAAQQLCVPVKACTDLYNYI